jgi:predicted DNA-binding protein (MmcQ/YjbR family)
MIAFFAIARILRAAGGSTLRGAEGRQASSLSAARTRSPEASRRRLVLRSVDRSPCDHGRMAKKTLETLELELRDFAMTYPESHEDHPWGHRAIKVKAKAFVFLGGDKNTKELSISVKLPQSRDMATDLPFAEPTGYGLGKSGWITARFAKAGEVPLELLKKWIDESYRAIAPKKLVKTL